jgi:hypothetical protein
VAEVAHILEKLANKGSNRFTVINQVIVINDEDKMLLYLFVQFVDQERGKLLKVDMPGFKCLERSV